MKRPSAWIAVFAGLALLIESTGAADFAMIGAPAAARHAALLIARPNRTAAARAATAGWSAAGERLEPAPRSDGLAAPGGPLAAGLAAAPSESAFARILVLAGGLLLAGGGPAYEDLPIGPPLGSVGRFRALRPATGAEPEPAEDPSGIAVARFTGPWKRANGLRYRINFLETSGFSLNDAQGLHYFTTRGIKHEPREVHPEKYWGRNALYFADDLVSYEIELVNESGRALDSLALRWRLETFEKDGSAGRSLAVETAGLEIRRLEAGAATKLLGQYRQPPPAPWMGSLLQNHLFVGRAEGAAIVDDPQAAIVDPPAFD